MTLVLFLEVNGYRLKGGPDKLKKFALDVANSPGNTRTVDQIKSWIRKHARIIEPRRKSFLFTTVDGLEQIVMSFFERKNSMWVTEEEFRNRYSRIGAGN